MARQRGQWSQRKLDRYLKEGYGMGKGDLYKPWITVSNSTSKGLSTRTPGWKTNRVHHFLSKKEMLLFYIFEWSPFIRDIREQFPLLKLDLAQKIADEMGINYYRCSQTGTPYVLTTDFMLSVEQEGKIVEVARTFKMSKELEKKRVIEKFELERRYYQVQGIDWSILTEHEVPELLAKNIEWLYSAYWLEPTSEMTIEELKSLKPFLKDRLKTSKTSVNQVTKEMDREMNFETGTSLYLFKHLVARKEILIEDMQNTKVNSLLSTEKLKVVNS